MTPREKIETPRKAAFCAFGIAECPCLEADLGHVFIHLGRTELECHRCGEREPIPLPSKVDAVTAQVNKHHGCAEKRGRDA